MYAGLGETAGDAEVWRYNATTSLWTKVGGDAINSSWADSTYEIVNSLTSHGGDLYAGLGQTAGDAEVWRYNATTSLWTKVGGDAVNSSWADVTYEHVRSLVSHGGDLYAGLGQNAGDAEVWRYNATTSLWTKVGGDAVNSSWADSTYEYVRSLATHRGDLYAGLGYGHQGASEVWKYDTAQNIASANAASSTFYTLNLPVASTSVYFDTNASTTNLLIPVATTTNLEYLKRSVTLPSGLLSISNDYNNAGGKVNPNGGTVLFDGTTATGLSTWNKIGGDGVNFSWPDSTHDSVISSVSYGGSLYVGLGSSAGEAEVWGYNATTSLWTKVGGDTLNSSWADSTYESVLSLAFHAGDLYAGLGQTDGEAEVWRLNATTSLWTKVGDDSLNSAWTSGHNGVYSLVSHNGDLYAGLGTNIEDAEVWRYNATTSLWTMIGGDSLNSGWLTGYDIVSSLASHNGDLYAGLGQTSGNDEAEVWRYNATTSQWTLVGDANLNSAWGTGLVLVQSLISHDGNLYAGLGFNASQAEVWRYNATTSLWTQVGDANLNSAWGANYNRAQSLASYGGDLYVALEGDTAGEAEAWRYNATTSLWTKVGGDALNSSWADSTYEKVYSIILHGGDIYAGLGADAGEAEVWRFDVGQDILGTQTGTSSLNKVIFSGATPKNVTVTASTSDFTINSGATTTGPHNQYLYINGNLAVNGAYVHNSATTTFIGTTTTISGNLTGTSALGNIDIRSGTTTFSNNASTSNVVITTTPKVYGTYQNFSFDTNASGNTDPHGITPYNGFFWVTDATAAEVYKYNSYGTYTNTSFDTSANATGPSGITFNNGFFWVTCNDTDEVYMYNPDGTYANTSFDTAASGNTSPYGITYYNNFFWIADVIAGEVYKYNSDGTYAGASFDTDASGNTQPRGITFYGGFFWVTDNNTDEVYKYNADGTYTGTSFDTAASGSGAPYGITYYNGFFWLADITADEVYKYNEPNPVVAPTLLTVSGSYQNNSVFTHNSGTVFAQSSVARQSFGGNMLGTSAFNKLTIDNTSGTGSTTPGFTFTSAASSTGLFTITASSSVNFLANATSSFASIDWTGTAASRITLRSSSEGTKWGLHVSGSQSATYVDVADSNACSGNPDISNPNGYNSGGNTCWSFAAAAPNLEQLHYRWREDNGTESGAPWLVAEDTAITTGVRLGDRVRLRILMDNAGSAAAGSVEWELEYASSTDTYVYWVGLPGVFDSLNGSHFSMDPTIWFADGASTTHASGLTEPAGPPTFRAGFAKTQQRRANPQSITAAQYTENEYSFESTSHAVTTATYRFRLTNAGLTTNFTYTRYPELTLINTARPTSGGNANENSGAGGNQSGGGQGGGSGSEGSGSGGNQGGGGQGGGGNLE